MTNQANVTHPAVAGTGVSGANAYDELFRRQRIRSRQVRGTSPASRVQKLLKLQHLLVDRRADLHKAMAGDFAKCAEEVDLTEIVPVVLEVRHTARYLERWMKPRKVRMPLPLLGTASEVHYDPKGVALIISPWNYPVNLTLGPLVAAIGAGNCAVLKPSELTPHTSAFILRLISDMFEPDEVAVVTGDHEAASGLLALPFDHIFFTGSPAVGRIVMRSAATHLSSITLELGGKSPAIVTATADIESAAHAIAWGKFSNAGQACVAPDFVLVDAQVADSLTSALVRAIDGLLGQCRDASESPDFARIIGTRHFDRIDALVTAALQGGARVITGGERDRSTCYFAPTILADVPETAAIRTEEIFGPILTIDTYGEIEEVIARFDQSDPPLALYIFTADGDTSDYLLSHSQSGGVVINDVGIHFANPHLPFGGIKSSGIGRSHGHAGFLAFSNERAVMRQRLKRPPTRALYPPYGETTRRLIDWFLRFAG